MKETENKTKDEVMDKNKTDDKTVDKKREEPQKKKSKKESRKEKKNRIYDATLNNDIDYRGPLSYRALKIIGWFSLVFSQYVTIMENKNNIVGTTDMVGLGPIFNALITSLGLPMILISTFAVLLNRRDNFKNLLIINGGITGAITLAYLFFYYRYALGLGAIFFGDRIMAASQIDKAMGSTVDFTGYISFNIFLDIFLCTLFMFFLDYTPKKYFQGNKIRIFRAMAVLPVIYEIGCIILKLMATDNKIIIPMALYPFLTTKPPLCFVMFVFIILHTKNMEKKFLGFGKTHEQYKEYVKTNTNSFQFSKYLAKLVAIFAVIDLIQVFVLIIVYFVSSGVRVTDPSQVDAMTDGAIKWVTAWGGGEVMTMVLSIPILFLFSYTRTHKNKGWDVLIPVFGVVAIVLVYIEGIFQILDGIFRASMNAMME